MINLKSVQILTIAAVPVMALTIMGGLTYAESTSAEEKIGAIYTEFASILNDQGQPEAIMDFLHEKVDQDANFTMKISNPDAGQAQDTESVLTKADYINSYLYGPRMVQNYKVSINVENTESLPEKGSWVSRVTFVESGNMRTPYDVTVKPKPFSSFTTCDAVHGFAEGKKDLVVKQANCFTEIFYEQEV